MIGNPDHYRNLAHTARALALSCDAQSDIDLLNELANGIELLLDYINMADDTNDALDYELRVCRSREASLYEAMMLVAAPRRPDGTFNRDREACQQLAESILGMIDRR